MSELGRALLAKSDNGYNVLVGSKPAAPILFHSYADHPRRLIQIQHGDGPGPRWGWNGDVKRPTFTPSVLVRSGHYVPGYKTGGDCWCAYYAEHPDEERDFECGVCHSFVIDGSIQFLGDCTHALAGQTVPLAEFPEGWGC